MDYRDMTPKEFFEFADSVIQKEPKKRGIYVKFPCDLRMSLQQKQSDCHGLSRWTAFINNAGTLCHVVAKETDIMIRITFQYPVKHLDKFKQRYLIFQQIKHWVNIDD